MRAGTRRRLIRLAYVVAFGTLIGAAYGTVLHLIVYGIPPLGALIGGVHAVLLSVTLGWLEIFGVRTRLGRAVEQAPFLVTLALKAAVYGSMIAVVNIYEPGTRLVGVPVGGGSSQIVGLIFSFLVTAVFIFVLQISQIIGGRTLRDWVLGRYHRPRQEERFFLFVDLAGSTALAERLGPAGVHHFLNRIFLLASDPVDDHHGEIYQYIGDEIVVTWTESEGRCGARPLSCFFDIERTLESAARGFVRDFGVVPRVRGAVHVGPVIVGEVGGSKRDIVFHGDVLNTTSRLEQLAREWERPLVASAAALERCRDTEAYVLEDLGSQVLRGRASPMLVYAVARNGRV
jgi:adenylate cyclase